MNPDKETREIVNAIIGDIPDLNFYEDDMENISDEEVDEWDRQYEEDLKNGLVPELSEEEKERGRIFIKSITTWVRYRLYMESISQPFYDYQEWTNLAKKPEFPDER